MDHVYPTKDYKEYVIKDSMEELRNVVINSELPNSFEMIAQTLNITEEELKQKSIDICSLYEDYGKDNPTSSSKDKFSDFPEEALELNCIKFLRTDNVHFKEARFKESHLVEKRKEVDNQDSDIEIYGDSLLTIRVYEPFKYTPCIKNHPRFHLQYSVLGSNLLTELRDIFYCNCNFGPYYEISNCPTVKILHDENGPNPGFFFVHDTFYRDTRNSKNPDYSDCIIKWMSRFQYTRKFKTAEMQTTRFEDLKIRIGYPCVYQHCGACEHLFCITSVDLIDSSDKLNRSEYPKLTLASHKRPIPCDICNQTESEFVVTNCPLHVKDPTRLCERCFYSFHYLDKATKTCDFNAYKLQSVNPTPFENTVQVEELDARDSTNF